MKSINRILVITPDYPIDGEVAFPFVKNLCDAFVRQGRSVTIVALQSKISNIRHHKVKRPIKWFDVVDDKQIVVYQPNCITIPNRFYKINNKLRRISLNRFLRKQQIEADVCYCHFWRSGYTVLPYVKERKMPLFVATGEGGLQALIPVLRTPAFLEVNKYLNGAISVSSNNRNISQEIGLINGKDCLVAPNAIDSRLYYPRDGKTLREQYGFSKDDFIVAFVGAFNERKGPHRVASAIEKVGGVKSFFIGGQGESAYIEPQCDGILFKGKLPHDIIPDYLCMADVFVLPTFNEGCCNAIVEALACGLPVVSSSRPFNFDVLNETNSIMVDPTNVDEIAAAIRELKENPERRRILSEGALRMAKELTIHHRAEKILNFMEKHIN